LYARSNDLIETWLLALEPLTASTYMPATMLFCAGAGCGTIGCGCCICGTFGAFSMYGLIYPQSPEHNLTTKKTGKTIRGQR